MQRHVAILGFAYLVIGALTALGAIAAALFGLGGGLAALFSGEDGGLFAGGLAVFAGAVTAVIILVLAALNALTGFGLLARRGWGRVLGIVASALNVLSFSLLSLLGLYGLWVLLSREGARTFDA